MVNVDLATIVTGLVNTLAGLFPGIRIYPNPTQQMMNSALSGTDKSRLPCIFILDRPGAKIECGIQRFKWQPFFEILYLGEQYSTTQSTDYRAAAQILDENLETFSAGEGAGAFVVRTYNRKWTIELQALHYLIDLKQFVRLPRPAGTPMETLTINQKVKGDDVDTFTGGIQ
ncbi:MAG: hypothetical protein P4N59_25725 [Negativicutes bacterium]|nr:hypothetical protein [Negativicutes bacterium]